MKLGTRLQTLNNVVHERMEQVTYARIWDTCCDHGQLGASILKDTPAEVVFVDIVPELVETLNEKLMTFFPPSSHRWQTKCMSVLDLDLALDTDVNPSPQLVIIAGVGGDLMSEFIVKLCQKHAHLPLEFLLCPVHHQFTLRQQLRELGLTLINEQVVEENRRYYEVLFVKNTPEESDPSEHKASLVTEVGEELWGYTNDIEKAKLERYLAKLLEHYQRMARGNPDLAKRAMTAYQKVVLKSKQKVSQ